jgi:hypothetical protein
VPSADRASVVVATGYSAPRFLPLDRVRVLDRFPWGGPTFDFQGQSATVIGMEARYAPFSDEKYGNDGWDYKVEFGGDGPPMWLPSSALEPLA